MLFKKKFQSNLSCKNFFQDLSDLKVKLGYVETSMRNFYIKQIFGVPHLATFILFLFI